MAQEALIEELEEEETEEDQYLVFSIRSQEFGIQALQVKEITAVVGTTAVPNAPPYVDGILNLRGLLATVIDFRRRFEFPPKEHDEDTRIIIVEHKGYPIGIVVDSVEEVIRITPEKVQDLPESAGLSLAEEKYITGVGMLDNRLIILLDVDKVLSKSELIDMNAIEKAINESQVEETTPKAEATDTDTAVATERKRKGRRRDG